jgi:hypothetical protein
MRCVLATLDHEREPSVVTSTSFGPGAGLRLASRTAAAIHRNLCFRPAAFAPSAAYCAGVVQRQTVDFLRSPSAMPGRLPVMAAPFFFARDDDGKVFRPLHAGVDFTTPLLCQ